ncbi:MAG: hypothetical protein L6455_06395 [Kiritimatiellae bacterium]|nr:hypothetical protein [Verrucomicrobiota bacterium]MBU4290048.1 hypothetical protein [Verrucomicrobiota bacterium]MCG2679582.1 hypothetical protein [Kiritimatiellia bacterium]
MNDRLTRKDVERMVRDTVAGFPSIKCRACDCFQGFLTQLEIDAAEDVGDIVFPHKVEKDEMHGCLGCDPCTPGAAFAAYLKKGQEGRASNQAPEATR